MKNLLSLIILVGVIVFAIGCGGGEDADAPPQSQVSNEQKSGMKPDEAAGAGGAGSTQMDTKP